MYMVRGICICALSNQTKIYSYTSLSHTRKYIYKDDYIIYIYIYICVCVCVYVCVCVCPRVHALTASSTFKIYIPN